MLSVIIVVFLALLFYFVLKLLYNAIIIIVIAQLIARMKAKGEEIIKEKMHKGGQKENGEKG